MTRPRIQRIQVDGWLQARAPICVGGMGETPDVDLPFAVDGQGRPYVPGTSLAGPMRAWMTWRAGDAHSRMLWGYQPDEAKPGDGGLASRILIEDAPLPLEKERLEVREGVGIDRVTGAAAFGIKYNRAVLPRDTRIPLSLRFELPDDNQLDLRRYLVADLLEALQNGRIGFGAARSRGLGRVVLSLDRLVETRLHVQEEMLALLKKAVPSASSVDALRTLKPAPTLRPCPALSIEVAWKPVGPFMVKAEGDGFTVDMLPLTGTSEQGRSLLLPGSSVKGSLRSMAERIVRTILDQDASIEDDPKQRFLKQLDVPLVTTLFGSPARHGQDVLEDDAPEKSGKAAGEPVKPRPGLGALGVEDCHELTVAPDDLWRGLETARDEDALRAGLAQDALPTMAHAFHVAIDRWTGGAADGLLYSTLEPFTTTWEPIRMQIDLRRIPEAEQLPAVTLLLLTLRELARGRLPLGFATQRGMGTLEVHDIRLNGNDLPPQLEKLVTIALPNGAMTALPQEVRASLTEAWQSWVGQQSSGVER